MPEVDSPNKRVPVMLMSRELGIGGTERQLVQTALSLDRSHFETHVGCFFGDGFRAASLRAAQIPILELPVRSFMRWSAVDGAMRMVRYLRRHRIQVVHTFDVPMDVFGVPVARFARTPVVISSQRAHRDLTPGLYTRLLRFTDRMVDALVVNSRAVERELTTQHHVPPSLIRFWPNSIEPSEYHTEPRVRQPQVADAELVIGSLCALRPEKGLELLLEAFAQAQIPQATLLMVGSGPSEALLKERAAALGLGDRCRFVPMVTNAAEWYRSIDIYVLPSRSEASSNSLLEAMSCGCCVIASNTGGNPELVEGGVSGLLFTSGDSNSLREKLLTAASDRGLRGRLAQAASEKIRREFSVAASAERAARLYTELLKRR
ncbi:MAG TPA: glycosyltransferase family 4 protein [Bryobacteraceae bacterium]|nr:glycosyltransferase family 4 protein [Bryobacteraceae bacterium]